VVNISILEFVNVVLVLINGTLLLQTQVTQMVAVVLVTAVAALKAAILVRVIAALVRVIAALVKVMLLHVVIQDVQIKETGALQIMMEPYATIAVMPIIRIIVNTMVYTMADIVLLAQRMSLLLTAACIVENLMQTTPLTGTELLDISALNLMLIYGIVTI
jgi:hypothetical protein